MRSAVLGGLIVGLVVGLALASGTAKADADPCNFNDGSSVFSYARVMACYESVPFSQAERTNTVAFLRAARERSDLREIMQARYGWREKLAELATRSFASDHEFQLALVDNHKQFYNPHWRYQRPYCYTQFLASFIPFDFGSTVVTTRAGGKPEQIVFIEAAPYRADLYQSFTGIDANAYVGMRVLSVNGEPALEYFRRFGTEVYRFDENPGQGLNEVLQNAAYSLRVSPSHDVPHARAVDVLVLESRTGQRISLEVPWAFAPRSAFGLGQWSLSFSESSAEFAAMCNGRSSVSYIAGSASAGAPGAADIGRLVGAAERSSDSFREEIAEKRQLVRRLNASNRGPRSEYFEQAPGRGKQSLAVVVPRRDGAVAYQLGDRATIIRLADFAGDWKEEVMAAAEYACTHSERLVFDMRNNNGGYVEQSSWLTTYVLPERTSSLDHQRVGRLLASDAGRNELTQRMTAWTRDVLPAQGYTDTCWWGYEPGCFLDATTEEVLGEDGWSEGATLVRRGNRDEWLTRAVLYRPSGGKYAQRDAIPCPGKFRGKTLVVYSNGTGVSAGYFWPAHLRPDATIVTSGGFLGEPIVYGVARGGSVWGMNGFEAWAEQYLEAWYGPATHPLPYMVRNVDSFIEQPAAHQRRSPLLYIDDPALGDAHIDVWSDSPGTDAWVYGKVLNAVQALR